MVTERSRHIPCIIPCGGSSTRFGTGRNKCLEGAIPLLEHVVDFWRLRGIHDFVFIIGGEHALETSETIRGVAPDSITIDRGETTNLVQAIMLASNLITDRFILALGDCLNFGDFTASWNVDFGVGVCLTDVEELYKNYLVCLSHNTVVRLVEKPTGRVGLCGMGTFFLHKRFFDYVRRLKLPNEATSVDLTSALQLAIGGGEAVYPIYFKGTYINVTYPQDLLHAEKMYYEHSCRP